MARKYNIENKKSTNKEYETYRNLFTLRQKPVSLAFIEKLALELIMWARDNEDALKITQFYRLKGINSNDMKRWEERSDKLRAAHEFALMVIGDRREIGALKNKLNAGIVMKTMSLYDQNWWDLELKRTELKIKAKEKPDSNTHFTIVMEDFSKDSSEKDQEARKRFCQMRRKTPRFIYGDIRRVVAKRQQCFNFCLFS